MVTFRCALSDLGGNEWVGSSGHTSPEIPASDYDPGTKATDEHDAMCREYACISVVGDKGPVNRWMALPAGDFFVAFLAFDYDVSDQVHVMVTP